MIANGQTIPCKGANGVDGNRGDRDQIGAQVLRAHDDGAANGHESGGRDGRANRAGRVRGYLVPCCRPTSSCCGEAPAQGCCWVSSEGGYVWHVRLHCWL